MLRITDKVTYLNREDWGANPRYPRLGGGDDPRGGRRFIRVDERVIIPEHHSVMIDNDTTKNIWETLDEISRKQQQVQTIRPDLGMDVPYSDCIYFMPNGKIIVCEGRGYYRSGAHTIGYNLSGYGLCFMGNFQDFGPSNLGPWIPQISTYLGHLKYTIGMRNLGRKAPHRTLNSSFTACPGDGIIATIPQQRYTRPQEEDMADLIARAQINVLIESAHLQQDELDLHTSQIDFHSAILVEHQARLDAGLGAIAMDPVALTKFQDDLANATEATEALKARVEVNTKKLEEAGAALSG